MPEYTPTQLAQARSLLQDEQRALSIGGLAVDLSTSRATATVVLSALAGESCTAVYCKVQSMTQEGVPVTTFQLVQEPYNSNAMEDSSRTLYALTLAEGGEALSTAGERQAAAWRQHVTNGDAGALLTESTFDVIAPSPNVLEAYRASIQQGQKCAKPAVPEAAPCLSKLARGPKKTTTAASFFGSQATKTATTATTKSSTTNKSASASSTNITKPQNHQDEKENTADSKVGNADDFLGDAEDDSDEEMVHEEEEQPVPQRKKGKKKVANRLAIDDSDSDDEEKKPKKETKKKKKRDDVPVTGAMDAFAKQTKPAAASAGAAGKPKRRRKKLIEKTSVDAHGYLHTETQEVWEDIPSDEEEPEVVVSKPPPDAAPKKTVAKPAMKQGTLAGFFAKKK